MDEQGGTSKKSRHITRTDYILAQLESLLTKVDQLEKRNSSSNFFVNSRGFSSFLNANKKSQWL